MNLDKCTVVIGGASSGKTAFAQDLVLGSGLRPVHIATAQAFDDEMAAKIARHRADRGDGWRNVDAPLDPGAALAGVQPGEATLLDCATMWLTNLLLAGADLEAAEAALMRALDDCAGPVVIVTNEVGEGIVPDNALARAFRVAQGGLNRRLAARADCVVAVIAGLPLLLKGRLP